MSRKNFIVVIYITIFIVAFALYQPNLQSKKEKTTNKTNSFSISGAEASEEFKYLSSIIEKNYANLPYLEESNTIDMKKLSETYAKKLNTDMNLPEYKTILQNYLKEFKDTELTILTYDQYRDLYNIFSSREDSVIYSLLKDEETKKVYSEFKNETENKTNTNLVLDTIGDKVAVIRIDDFNQRYKVEDGKKILEFLKKSNSYPYLVIDLRKNSGKSLTYVMDNLIKPLSKNTNVAEFKILQRTKDFPKVLEDINVLSGFTVNSDYSDTKEISSQMMKSQQAEQFPYYQSYTVRDNGTNTAKFKGEIYILQSEDTGEAGDFLCQFSNRTNFGKTVGTFTEGNGIAPVDSVVKLPKSHLLLSLPYGVGINEDGYLNNLNGTYPEIPVSEKEDSLDYVLNLLSQ
ncbi:S41 family peptidase [Lagierella sp.]|uniref:S41 family peptidase n=1 Tax=Lagierella sp. TaxID=2849657 RepID=UPI00260167F2|nr:S41 family peptidase [Lagierella sp.]